MFENEARLAALPAWLNPFKLIDPSEIAFLNVAQLWAADQIFPGVSVNNQFSGAPDGSVWSLGQQGSGAGWVGQNPFGQGTAVDAVLSDYNDFWRINAGGGGDMSFDNGFISSNGNGTLAASILKSPVINDSGNVTAFDIDNRQLLDQATNASVDFTNLQLRSNNITSVDWLNNELQTNNAVSLDWANGWTYDTSNDLSIDWHARQLYSGLGFATLEWTDNVCRLNGSTTGTATVLWNDQELRDQFVGLGSIAWQDLEVCGSGNDSTPGFAAAASSGDSMGGIIFGAGTPTETSGVNPGSLFINCAGASALNRIYQLVSGAWVGIL